MEQLWLLASASIAGPVTCPLGPSGLAIRGDPSPFPTEAQTSDPY